MWGQHSYGRRSAQQLHALLVDHGITGVVNVGTVDDLAAILHQVLHDQMLVALEWNIELFDLGNGLKCQQQIGYTSAVLGQQTHEVLNLAHLDTNAHLLVVCENFCKAECQIILPARVLSLNGSKVVKSIKQVLRRSVTNPHVCDVGVPLGLARVSGRWRGGSGRQH